MIPPVSPTPPSSTPILQVKNLKKSYAGRCVLDIDALNVFRSEILSLVGPSGAGKSTLLRLLNFLEEPSSGEIIFDGEQYPNRGELPIQLRRRITTVFQRPMLLDRTVFENVAYGLNLRGFRDSRKAIDAVLEEVGLIQLSRQRARTLSGGEAQRVALARAMVVKPDVLLLDEPTANLDPYNIGLIESIILRLSNEMNTTLVLVTHNIFQAHRLAQRIIFLLDGKVIEAASKEDFFNSPVDSRTRAFVNGEMIY